MIALRKAHARHGVRAKVRLIRSEEAERVSETGAVGSVQEAEVTISSELVAEIWKPEYLERLARSYWRWLSRATLGLIRVVYTSESRSAVLLSRRLPLLRFHAPDYETESGRGSVTWRIERGLLVAREGRDQGFLRITVRRPGDGEPSSGEETLEVKLEVRNFYPWLRGSGRFARFGAWFYGQTQLRIHELVCYAFLRSLGRLDLPPSQVGALAGETAPEPQPAPADSV
jgi:hypothetical protein